MLFADALFSVVILAKGLSASPKQSRPYFGLDVILRLPPFTDTLDTDMFSLFPAMKKLNYMIFIFRILN